MKYLLLLLIACAIAFVSPALALAQTSPDIISGTQIASSDTLTRLNNLPAQYRYQWVKYQYVLGSSQPIIDWVNKAHQSGYKVLVSVAKNPTRAIPSLKDETTEVSHQYCWYPDELQDVVVGHDANGNAITRKEFTPQDNGYEQFMTIMDALANRMKAANALPDAFEIWNEPNLADEWTNQGLGDINPRNYAIFLECGAKALRKGAGYGDKIISAALAPLAPYDDIKYFGEFVAADGLTGPIYHGKYGVSAVGYHGNVVKNIPPNSNNPEGFQRVVSFIKNPKVQELKLPIWMTEYGWSRTQAGIDRETQGQYIADAQAVAQQLGNIQAMFVFNYGFTRDAGTFSDWDVEGIQSVTCVPGGKVQTNKNYPTDKIVVAPSLQDDDRLTKKILGATVPQDVNDSFNQQADQNFQALSGSGGNKVLRSDVRNSFLAGLFSFFNGLGVCQVAPIQFFTGLFCSPPTSVGQASADNVATKNTEQATQRAIALGKTFRPDDVQIQTPNQDCNIGQFGTNNPGNEDISTISKNLGTDAGFYRADLPPLADQNDLTVSRENSDNIAVSQKLFTSDDRVPDVDVSQREFCMAHFPKQLYTNKDGKIDFSLCPYIDGQ